MHQKISATIYLLLGAVLMASGFFGYQYLVGLKDQAATLPITQPGKLTYQAPASLAGVKFQYPAEFLVELDSEKFGEQVINISKFDIENFDYSQTNTDIKAMREFYQKLTQGTFAEKATYFNRWNLASSAEIKQTASGKFFRTSATFAAFEDCDLKFRRSIEIPTQNSFITIDIIGDTEKIRQSLEDTDLLVLHDGCDSKSFEDVTGQKFWDLLETGGGSPAARAWYEAGNEVVQTLNF